MLPLASLLVGCSAAQHRFYEDPCAALPSYRSERLLTAVDNPFRDVQLQLFRSGDRLRGYLCLHAIPLEGSSGSVVVVSAEIDGVRRPIDTMLMDGGQRLLLDDETVALFSEALQRGAAVHLRLGRYEALLKGSQETIWERCLLRHRL